MAARVAEHWVPRLNAVQNLCRYTEPRPARAACLLGHAWKPGCCSQLDTKTFSNVDGLGQECITAFVSSAVIGLKPSSSASI